MAEGRLHEAKACNAKRSREREVHSSEPYRDPANHAQERRSSRPKAPWPLDTLFGSASARVFGGRSEDAKHRRQSRDISEAIPDGAAGRQHPAEATLGVASAEAGKATAISGTPIPQQASKKASLELSDLPVTPPDSGVSDFRIPAVANLESPPFAYKEPSHLESDPYTRFLDKQPEGADAAFPVKTPSKNDIFSRSSVWIPPAPPPRPPKVPTSDSSPIAASTGSPPSASIATSQRTASTSKNSLFFSPSSALTPPPSAAVARIAATLSSDSGQISPRTPHEAPSQPKQGQLRPARPGQKPSGHSRKASLGRANTEEMEREQARIRQTKEVEFRLCPTKEFLLGEGRHCNVFLGSYYSKRKADQDHGHGQAAELDRQPDKGLDRSGAEFRHPEWKLCAIKRLHADRHSQLLGLDEAFALRRLGPHPNVIRLIDIRDEVEFTPSPQPSPKAAMAQLGRGAPRTEKDATALEMGESAALHVHGRSTSDMTGKAAVISETRSLKRMLAAQKEEEAANKRGIEVGRHTPSSGARTAASLRLDAKCVDRAVMPTFNIAAPVEDRVDNPKGCHAQWHSNGEIDAPLGGSAPRQPMRSAAASSGDPPRLLILLELLPNSLANYCRLHAERIDFDQWHAWAREMASAVEWLHDKGCVHADLKKENMLLTDELNIKLCDFNSAVFPNPSDLPTDGMGLGTPAYGAPELSRATGGPGASSFSFPIDIYSLGAVLYSLATGVEPFSTARSVVEILQRKKAFFESEENSRSNRVTVFAGSNPASSAASRSNSMRGRHKEKHDEPCISPGAISRSLAALVLPNSPTLGSGSGNKRGTSTDSLESVASSITTMSGRNPSSYAIARLLDPSPEPKGLLINENEVVRKGLLSPAFSQHSGVERRASMGKLQQKNASLARIRTAQIDDEQDRLASRTAVSPPSRPKLAVPPIARPDVLRRTSSFGDGVQAGSESVTASRNATGPPSLNITTALPPRIEEVSSPPIRPSGLRKAVIPSDADVDHETPTLERWSSQLPPWADHDGIALAQPAAEGSHRASPVRNRLSSEGGTVELDDFYQEDLRPYTDGHPALILPGGGRLPDQARELLRSMLQAAPHLRPTAREVRLALEQL